MPRRVKAVPNYVKKNANTLRGLADFSATQRGVYVKHADNDFVKCVCDCTKNVLNGNVPIKTKDLTRLKKYKRSLRRLTGGKLSAKGKRNILVQKGGAIFGALLPIILSAVLPAILGKR